MLFLKHVGRLLGDLFAYGLWNRSVLLPAVIVLLLLLAALILGGEAAVPMLYTLF